MSWAMLRFPAPKVKPAAAQRVGFSTFRVMVRVSPSNIPQKTSGHTERSVHEDLLLPHAQRFLQYNHFCTSQFDRTLIPA
jgi:hypothetical protein